MKLTANSRNILFIYSGDAVSRLLGLLAVSYLARVLGPSDFGTISIGLAALAYAMVLGNSGLKLLGTRKIAGETDNIEYLTGNILIARLILSTIVFSIGISIVYFFIAANDIFNVILVYLLGVFPAAVLLEWFFHGHQKLGIIAGGKIFGMFGYLVFVLLFVKTPNDIIWVAWAWIIGISTNTIFLWIVFRLKKFRVCFQRNRLNIKSILIEALPLGAASIIAQITTQFPPLFLGLVAAKSDVGLFSAAFKITVFLLIFDRVFYAIFFPRISRCFHKFPEKLEENVKYVLKITTVLVLIIGLYAILSGEFIVNWIFGSSFRDAVPIFQVLVGYFVLNLVNSVFSFTLIGIEKEKVYTKSLLWGMIAFFISLLFLTKSLGTVGVAYALISYQFTALVIMAVALKRQITLNYIRFLILPFLGTFLVLIPLLLYENCALIIKLIITTGVGFPVIAWLGGIGRNEINFLGRKFI